MESPKQTVTIEIDYARWPNQLIRGFVVNPTRLSKRDAMRAWPDAADYIEAPADLWYPEIGERVAMWPTARPSEIKFDALMAPITEMPDDYTLAKLLTLDEIGRTAEYFRLRATFIWRYKAN